MGVTSVLADWLARRRVVLSLARGDKKLLAPAAMPCASNAIRIALNTRRPERLAVSLTSAASVNSRGQCKELEERSAKSFHYVCDFKLEPPFGGGKATLAVTRKMPGVRESTAVFELIVHDPLTPIVDRSR